MICEIVKKHTIIMKKVQKLKILSHKIFQKMAKLMSPPNVKKNIDSPLITHTHAGTYLVLSPRLFLSSLYFHFTKNLAGQEDHFNLCPQDTNFF